MRAAPGRTSSPRRRGAAVDDGGGRPAGGAELRPELRRARQHHAGADAALRAAHRDARPDRPGRNKLGASAAGTLAEASVERFSPFQGAITRGGQPLGSVVSADFTYSNNLDKVEVIRGDGRIEDADPGMVMMSGNVTVRFANTVLSTRQPPARRWSSPSAGSPMRRARSCSRPTPSTCRGRRPGDRSERGAGHLRVAGGQGHDARQDRHRDAHQQRRDVLTRYRPRSDGKSLALPGRPSVQRHASAMAGWIARKVSAPAVR